MKNNESDDRILDFSKMKQKHSQRMKARKKVILLVIASLTAVVALVLAVLFFQVREVVDQKDFWQNFQASQQNPSP